MDEEIIGNEIEEVLPESSDELETAEETEESAPQEEELEPVSKKTSIQKRIDELTRKRHEAEAKGEYWKGRFESLIQGETKELPTSKDDTPPKPKESDFEDYAEFVEALADWKTDVKLAKIESKQKQSKEEEYFENWKEQGTKKFSDFADVVLRQPRDGGPYISQAMADAIKLSPQSHELAYYLGKNKEESARISELSPLAAARELGKIEAKLSLPTPIKAKKTTDAPAPIKPIGSEGSMVKDPAQMSMEEYYAYRSRQEFGPNWKRSSR